MDPQVDQIERDRIAEEAMQRDGVATHAPVIVDYFAFGETHKVMLPDGTQWIEHKTLNEGARRRYLNATNREIAVSRQSGDMRMKMATGDELHILLEEAICDWSIFQSGKALAFSKGSPGSTLSQFLDKVDPSIVDLIAKDVRKHNPWLLADVTVEGIDEQIADLNEMRERLVKEQEGNGTSSPA